MEAAHVRIKERDVLCALRKGLCSKPEKLRCTKTWARTLKSRDAGRSEHHLRWLRFTSCTNTITSTSESLNLLTSWGSKNPKHTESISKSQLRKQVQTDSWRSSRVVERANRYEGEKPHCVNIWAYVLGLGPLERDSAPYTTCEEASSDGRKPPKLHTNPTERYHYYLEAPQRSMGRKALWPLGMRRVYC